MKNAPPSWHAHGIRISLRLEGVDAVHSCILLQIGNGQIHLRCSEWFGSGFHVVVTVDDISLTGEVSYCKPKMQGYLICIEVAPESDARRREPRFPINLPAKVIMLNDTEAMVVPGIITDLSGSGLGLHVSSKLEVGSFISIATETMLIAGEVRHCKEREDGSFVAGLATTDVFTENYGIKPPAGGAVARARRLMNKMIKHLLP